MIFDHDFLDYSDYQDNFLLFSGNSDSSDKT